MCLEGLGITVQTTGTLKHSGTQLNLKQTDGCRIQETLLQNWLISVIYKKPFKFHMKMINASKEEWPVWNTQKEQTQMAKTFEKMLSSLKEM